MPPELESNAVTEEFATRSLKEHVLLYPSEDLVRFLSRIKTRLPEGAEGLDVGFGSGRHLKLMMDFGIRAHGVDLSPEALRAFRAHFADSPLLGELVTGDVSDLALGSNRLDVAILWGVLFLRPIAQMRADLTRIVRMLKPGGALCVNFRTRDNWFFGLGTELSPGHYLLDERAGPYRDALYTFVGEGEARDVVASAGLEIESLERCDYWKGPQKQRHSWYVVCARKPE
jgi:SAM-dependent methyltransferase